MKNVQLTAILFCVSISLFYSSRIFQKMGAWISGVPYEKKIAARDYFETFVYAQKLIHQVTFSRHSFLIVIFFV